VTITAPLSCGLFRTIRRLPCRVRKRVWSPPSDGPRRCTAAPWLPLDAPSVSVGNRDCVRRRSGPICVAEPASPLAGLNGPAPSGCQAFAPRRPASGFPPVAPVVVGRSHATAVAVWRASTALGARKISDFHAVDPWTSFIRFDSLVRLPAVFARRLLPATARN
jgi:hypothetical protein